MKRLGWGITIAAIAATVVGTSCIGVKRYDCQRHNADFADRIARIKHDAHEQLKIGTKKADVAQFFAEHKIPFEVVALPYKEGGGFEATGTLHTTGGCAPLGCGTNRALIGVRVSVDADGTVIGEPEVVSMYTDCL